VGGNGIGLLGRVETAMNPGASFCHGPVSLRIQSIVYRNDQSALLRAFESVDRAVEMAMAAGLLSEASMNYGDCSPTRMVDDILLTQMKSSSTALREVSAVFFDANLGTARGHNRLQKGSTSTLLMIMNPDVVLAPDALIELIKPFQAPGVGMTEGRQVPIEHPKTYDQATGETAWASTATAVIPNNLFEALNGFDADTFFLYCDDVDFSWRVRLAGYKIIFQASAAVFHDKRLSEKGGWLASDAEKYYSAEAALLMAYKWSRPNLLKRYLAQFKNSPESEHQRAAAEFLNRESNQNLPAQLDRENKIGVFVKGNYARHRFDLFDAQRV
jgi:hypothetical protein